VDLPHIMKYERNSDGLKIATTGIAIQMAKSHDISASDFHTAMVEKWKMITTKRADAPCAATYSFHVVVNEIWGVF
jgi:hypothetical protein